MGFKWERVPQTYMLNDCSESLWILRTPAKAHKVLKEPDPSVLIVLEPALEVGDCA